MNPTSRQIGQILCKEGYLKQSQLEQALKEQQKIGRYRPLGQILLELGYITTEQLDKVAAIQQALHSW